MQPSLSRQIEKELRLFYKSRNVFKKETTGLIKYSVFKECFERGILTEFRYFVLKEKVKATVKVENGLLLDIVFRYDFKKIGYQILKLVYKP